jgi:cyclin A
MRGYGGYENDGADDMDALLRDIYAAVIQRTPPGHAPQPVAAGADLDLDAVLRGIRSIRIPTAGFATCPSTMDSAVSTPTTPSASLPAPFSYGDAAAEDTDDSIASTATTIQNSPKKQQDPGQTYDADIDTTFRAMEQDPAERPSATYLWTVQEGGITMADRANVVAWMYNFAGYYGLAPGTLHRAVSYVDRFLSSRKIHGYNVSGQLLLLGSVAVFTAAKYEDRRATLALNADAIAMHVGCARRDVVDTERILFAALGCRLSGPTAHSFVDHFTRHDNGAADEGSTVTVRSLAHHLADVALLDYRSIRFLPSTVAASAIALAKLNMNPSASWSKEIKVTGYTLDDLATCMAEIEEMHRLQSVWPGCAEMTEDYMRSYGLLPH